MNVDKTNNIQSISSQRHKHNRVFVGIIVMVDSHEYCIPLSTVSSKDKYERVTGTGSLALPYGTGYR